jgi:hypothetical protein
MAKKRKYSLGGDITGVAFSLTDCGHAATPLTDPNTGGSAAPAGTTFISGPGKTLTNVHVQLIFWGAWWNNNPLAAQVNNADADLLAGPYMTYLAQYGVHRGNVRGITFANDSEPGTFSHQSVGNFINNLLHNDRLPEPDEGWPIVYAVIMPANSAFSGDSRIETVPLPPSTVSQVTGANTRFIWSDKDIFDVDNDPAYFLWTGNDGTLDFITTVLSHELVELATDPNGGNGVRLAGCAGASCQIGDVCQGWCDFVRRVKAQAYWSQLDGTCVLPKMYSVRRTLLGRESEERFLDPTQA